MNCNEKLFIYQNDIPGTHISKMCADSKFHKLFVADNHGFISSWNIQNYALNGREENPPECKLYIFMIVFFDLTIRI